MNKFVAWAVLAASLCHAGPLRSPNTMAVANVGRSEDLVLREALEQTVHKKYLDKRLSEQFSLDKAWKNEELFDGMWKETVDGEVLDVSLAITCVDCYTKGTVTASLTDVLDPSLKVSFSGVEAHVDLAVAVSDKARYTLNLFRSQTPIGLGFPGLSLGVVFYVDLVFYLSEAIGLEGGFSVTLPDDAYVEASLLGGDVVGSAFAGLQSKSLPVQVKSGSGATFQADLRLRVQCGAEGDLLHIVGGALEVGIYANIIEFIAEIGSSSTCALQATELWDLNVGAFALAVAEIDYQTFGFAPTVSTTLLQAPVATQCLVPLVGDGSDGSGSDGSSGGSSGSISTSSAPLTDIPGGVFITAGSSTSASASLSASVDVSASFSTSVSASASASGSASISISSTAGAGATASSSVASGNSATPAAASTSTLYSTTTYTITSCAASVVNCPASYQKEIVVTKTVTICPEASATTTATATATTAAISTTPAQPTAVVVVTNVVVLAPCSTPIVATFSAPSAATTKTAATTTAAAAVTLAVVPVAPAAKQYSNGTVNTPASVGAASASVATSTPAALPTTAVTAGADGLVQFARGASSMGLLGAVAALLLL